MVSVLKVGDYLWITAPSMWEPSRCRTQEESVQWRVTRTAGHLGDIVECSAFEVWRVIGVSKNNARIQAMVGWEAAPTGMAEVSGATAMTSFWVDLGAPAAVGPDEGFEVVSEQRARELLGAPGRWMGDFLEVSHDCK